MARLAATVVLLLSLLTIASCRVIEAEPETVVAISDDQSQADTAVPQEMDAAEAIPSLPTVAVAESILRLPSHRRPCRHGFLHRHLRWARNHGLSHRRGAFSGPGDARVHPVFLPEEPMEAELEAVAEPDPDSRPDIEVEEVEEKDMKKPPHGDGDDEEELRRFRGHGLRFHHRHDRHEHAVDVAKDDSEHQEQQDKEDGAGDMQLHHVKQFSRHLHHHNHGDEEQEETARKHYFHRHHDSDNEVDEVEELARKLSKAIMRRSFSRGGIRHHLHHHHHHAEEGGVRKWFKRLINMNRF
ncbi:unnamed protein product [Alopecurus aequalis]